MRLRPILDKHGPAQLWSVGDCPRDQAPGSGRQMQVRLISASSSSRETGTPYSAIISSRSRGGIADPHLRPARGERDQPIEHPGGEVALIGDIAGQDDIPAIVLPDDVTERDTDAGRAVQFGVQGDGGLRERVDLGGLDRGGAGLDRGNGDQPGAGGEIQHALARDDLGMVENVTRQRLPAGPGERPERRRQAHLAELLLGAQPDRHRFLGEVQRDLRHHRHRQKAGLGADEGGGRYHGATPEGAAAAIAV